MHTHDNSGMARRLKFRYPGGIYQVTARGDVRKLHFAGKRTLSAGIVREETQVSDDSCAYLPNITTEAGRFILGEAPVANPVIINGDTSAPAARAGGLGFYWKQLNGDNSNGPLWSNDSIASCGVTISGNTWTPPNSVTPVHDDDGNLTYDGRWDNLWDAENRLIRMQTTDIAASAGVPRQRLDFVYDCQNRRVSKTVSTSTDGTTWTFSSSLSFLYDGWNMIAEYSASSGTPAVLTLQAANVWGIDLSATPQGAGGVGGLLCSTLITNNSATNNYYPAYDGNGNVSAWLDSSGTLLARMDYSPFGQLVAQYKYTSNASAILSRLPFGFSTKYTDKETGLLYYGHRYYDPVTGRWPSKDPIEENGGLNLYGFVSNDGIGKWDIFGLWSDVKRDNHPWATVCAEKYDTWQGLADKLKLDSFEADKWVKNYDGPWPDEGKLYEVPNTVFVYTSKVDWTFQDNWINVSTRMREFVESFGENAKEKGYNLVIQRRASDNQLFIQGWQEDGIFMVLFAGHGAQGPMDGIDMILGFLADPDHGDAVSPPEVHPPYKLSFAMGLACYSARNNQPTPINPADPLPISLRPIPYIPSASAPKNPRPPPPTSTIRRGSWRDHVSAKGSFIGYEDNAYYWKNSVPSVK